jgi:hypothetical protein
MSVEEVCFWDPHPVDISSLIDLGAGGGVLEGCMKWVKSTTQKLKMLPQLKGRILETTVPENKLH